MRILITGGLGQLGNELHRLLTTGTSEIGPIPARYEGAEAVFADLDDFDITDMEAVDAFFGDEGFDLVVNCAAVTNVDGCETNPELAFSVNEGGAANLARAVARTGGELVHISTDYVFSGTEPGERLESDPTGPTGVYGASKLAGEEAVMRECAKSYIVRTAWLYGYVGKNFVKTMLRVGREKGAATVVDDQHGNPTSANDLAHEILKIAGTGEYGVWHCTNNGVTTWYGFTKKIYELAGLDVDLKPCASDEYPTPTKRPANSALKNARLAATVGDEMRPWEEALASFIANLDELGN